MEDGVSHTRLDPDNGERFQRLRAELGVTTFGLNLVVLAPGQRSRIHRHARQEEVYLVLEGELALALEGAHDERTFGEGELVRVAPGVRRQLTNRRPQRLVLLALGGANEHDSRDGEAYASWEQVESTSPAETPFPDDVPVAPA
ncbi:MAG: Cupin 2 conserved barrel domain protein [Conexibacter sp.]|jgi:uncharacterized cupin superfamily protein|nr:Cupin 2 conserved barrel domain protein [Conexibacter sp.]